MSYKVQLENTAHDGQSLNMSFSSEGNLRMCFLQDWQDSTVSRHLIPVLMPRVQLLLPPEQWKKRLPKVIL